jgi:hypothetical protein
MPANRQDNWFERHPKKTILCLLVVLLCLMTYGAEKLLAYKTKGTGFNFALPYRAIRLREWRPLLTEYFQPTKEDVAEGVLADKKYLLRIDGNGFIMPSAKHAHPDLTLAFLGGSTTECRLVDEEHRFPYLAGLRLEKDLGISINSYNGARSGNHSLHSLDILLNKVLPLRPQIVVMLENINDLVILLYEKSYWNRTERSVILDLNKEIMSTYPKLRRDRLIPNLARELNALSANLRASWKSAAGTGSQTGEVDEFAHIRGKKLTFKQSELLAQFEMNLETFIGICKVRKIIPVLMTMSSRLKENPDEAIQRKFRFDKRGGGRTISYQDFKTLFDAFNDAIRKVARENAVLFIDLARMVPQEKEYIYDVVHYTDGGSLRAAEVISAGLKPLIKQIMSDGGVARHD